MQMFVDFESHAKFLKEMIEAGPEEVVISSFGIYAGITHTSQDTTLWGEKYALESRNLLDQLREVPNTKIVIGLTEYASCMEKKRCLDCEAKYAKQVMRVSNHAVAFPELQWRMTTKLHLKCVLAFYSDSAKGVAGGRNFSDSEWTDATFELMEQQIPVLKEHALGVWDKAVVMNDANVAKLLEEQGVSDEGIAKLLGPEPEVIDFDD
jgi:hypothetical protein